MIYFIRHGESEYNAVQAAISAKYGHEYLKTEQYQNAKFSKEYLDVKLNENGIKQCHQCKQNFKDIDVDLVIVSPLRRALKTCQIIFQNHKSMPNAKIIVDPAFREVLCSSNDIGSGIEESIKTDEYKSFDFGLIQSPDFWYLTNIVDKQIRERLLCKLQNYQDKKNGAIQITIQFLKQWFQKRQKDPQNKELLIKVLPSLQRQKQILLSYLKQYKSIAVVSHSQNIKSYVGYKIKNCQIYPYTQQRLENLKTN